MDIVDRLRGWDDASRKNSSSWETEAADEIDRLRAEVASLKEELTTKARQLSAAKKVIECKEAEQVRSSKQLRTFDEAVRTLDGERQANETLTQQLAAAQEYAERLREALTEIADDSAHAVAQDALALPMPWDAIRKSEG